MFKHWGLGQPAGSPTVDGGLRVVLSPQLRGGVMLHTPCERLRHNVGVLSAAVERLQCWTQVEVIMRQGVLHGHSWLHREIIGGA